MSFEAIPDEQLATVVTYLEMHARPELDVPKSMLRLEQWEKPGLDDYRRLFSKVGAPWLWFSRLVMSDGELAAIIHNPGIELFAVADDGDSEAGMLELDFRVPGECELSFVGLLARLAGQGHGRWLLSEAISRAWRSGVRRVHVHTCTLDHPAALAAYRRAGFTPVRRAIERFADPRLAGVLPRDCAPQVPVLGTDG